MRHKVFGRKLNRDVKERKALFKSLIAALITHGKIRTTIARAKAIRGLTEKLVTHAKEGSNSALRQVASFLNKRELINKLSTNIAPRFKDRLGGYLRMIRVGKRRGDASEEVILEWTVGDKKEECRKIKEIKKDGIENKKEKKV